MRATSTAREMIALSALILWSSLQQNTAFAMVEESFLKTHITLKRYSEPPVTNIQVCVMGYVSASDLRLKLRT